MHMIVVWEQVKVLCPIATRSWTFQEQILSRRLLHFGNGELLWECLEGSTCECTSTGELKSYDYRRHNKAKIYKVLSSNDPAEIAILWRNIVEQYSKLSMTLPKDVFPALSGIVKAFQDVRPNDEYLAGLWKSTILEDLAWEVCGNLEVFWAEFTQSSCSSGNLPNLPSKCIVKKHSNSIR
ncbi:hypothetical protein N431DRAFT_513267 [Stipitochalara longipes BDJ]|nr:hypothetical protein N431DRAFT_513267 [Stipitochalara longipes BDJ]